ncbi:hypothetical protein [Mycobacterium intracellulare]|uniref:hypothetical protein n=1 Tax=Mycobacterium intracellulare TaxID=1767 RepID=UPI001EED020A|nr:hypothetical protein [Mycobacterium intracellulare]MEE3755236.1 hypothetical protein [Mycobacterium intracellulare]
MQLLAAGVLNGSLGLDQGHIGRICDALIDSGLDLVAWTAKTLLAALNADMKARGWDWPDRIDKPAAFLRSRLALLPVRPVGAAESGVATAHRNQARATAVQEPAGETRQSAAARRARWYGEVIAVTNGAQRATLLRAHACKFGAVVDEVGAIAGAGRRATRLYPQLALTDALTRWAGEMLGDEISTAAGEQVPATTSLSADLLMDLAINGGCKCLVCGSHRATARLELPLKSMVCDQCWPMIAAELASGDTDSEWVAA